MHLITPVGWNSYIGKGASIDFGIQGSGSISDIITYILVQPAEGLLEFGRGVTEDQMDGNVDESRLWDGGVFLLRVLSQM